MNLSFEEWMNQSDLADSTAKAYAGVIKNTAFDLAKDASIVSSPLTDITSKDEFDSIAEQILALDLFKEMNSKRNNILSAAIRKYSDFLGADNSNQTTDGALLSNDQRKRLLNSYRELRDAGSVFSPEQLGVFCENFRAQFGPQILRGLDGEQLLLRMHDSGKKDTLIYWLEFKDDEEFPTYKFGSIAGGSAMKFRLFKRKETGIWQAADSTNAIVDISVDEAIEMARLHRDELLQGVELLEKLPKGASDEEYAQLQKDMEAKAPAIQHLGWAHKYFCLLFPDKLDDFHSDVWQKFHLIKLLQSPPELAGKYACAGRFVSMASELGLPTVTFDTTLEQVLWQSSRLLASRNTKR